MPRSPRGQKRPADVIGNAVRVMQIATGEADTTLNAFAVESAGKNPEAAEMGRLGGRAQAVQEAKTRLAHRSDRWSSIPKSV